MPVPNSIVTEYEVANAGDLGQIQRDGMVPAEYPAAALQRVLAQGAGPLRVAAPIPASSGKTHRHLLNRGGDRQANAALHRVALSRMRWDPRTRAYVNRRTKEGLSKKEIIRCLKRMIARELFYLLRPAENPAQPA